MPSKDRNTGEAGNVEHNGPGAPGVNAPHNPNTAGDSTAVSTSVPPAAGGWEFAARHMLNGLHEVGNKMQLNFDAEIAAIGGKLAGSTIK